MSLTTAAAAAQAGVTVDTIRTWCRKGVVTATKAAGRWAIEAGSLARRITIGQRRTHQEAPMTKPQPKPATAGDNINPAELMFERHRGQWTVRIFGPEYRTLCANLAAGAEPVITVEKRGGDLTTARITGHSWRTMSTSDQWVGTWNLELAGSTPAKDAPAKDALHGECEECYREGKLTERKFSSGTILLLCNRCKSKPEFQITWS